MMPKGSVKSTFRLEGRMFRGNDPLEAAWFQTGSRSFKHWQRRHGRDWVVRRRGGFFFFCSDHCTRLYICVYSNAISIYKTLKNEYDLFLWEEVLTRFILLVVCLFTSSTGAPRLGPNSSRKYGRDTTKERIRQGNLGQALRKGGRQQYW